MKQRGGCLWILVGLFLAIIGGSIAFATMLKASTTEQPSTEEAEPRAPVVVVARDVPPRTEILPEDLIVQELPISAIPANAVRKQEDAVGKVTTDRLIAGEILLNRRIAEPGKLGPQINFKITPGKVVMAYPSDDLLSRTGILEPGDVIDFIYTIEVTPDPDQTDIGDEENPNNQPQMVTFWGLQQVTITAVVLPPEVSPEANIGRVKPQSILIELDPQDALILKHLNDKENTTVDFVLRHPEDDTEFDPKPVNDTYIFDEYQIHLDQLP